ncbi:hypothetical protein [Hymenobacter algoricola]|uniref:Uncharacterized protein n=1 Tax=Hymenobacter algoricola TaxID=486267 RepID=A0ABP7NEM5_9BACT
MAPCSSTSRPWLATACPTQPGNGVWAPALGHYNKEFYIYEPNPDLGIFMTKA